MGFWDEGFYVESKLFISARRWTRESLRVAQNGTLAQELAARRIQKAVRARQTRQARQRATALAIAHTSARAPRNLVAAVAYNPNRVARLRRNYGLHANNF
jgi:hypothetical protein